MSALHSAAPARYTDCAALIGSRVWKPETKGARPPQERLFSCATYRPHGAGFYGGPGGGASRRAGAFRPVFHTPFRAATLVWKRGRRSTLTVRKGADTMAGLPLGAHAPTANSPRRTPHLITCLMASTRTRRFVGACVVASGATLAAFRSRQAGDAAPVLLTWHDGPSEHVARLTPVQARAMARALRCAADAPRSAGRRAEGGAA